MKRIKLYNRDGADLWLKKSEKQINKNTFVWELSVDDKHKYILKYCRFIGDYNTGGAIEAIDPSGGPMLSIGDTFEKKYKIVQINSANNIWISEGNSNN